MNSILLAVFYQNYQMKHWIVVIEYTFAKKLYRQKQLSNQATNQ